MINLELVGKHKENAESLRLVAEHMMRPYSRKYDKEEHTLPVEMEEVAKMIGQNRPVASAKSTPSKGGVKNGSNMMAVTAYENLCWGDTGLMLAMPGRGLGNAAISAVASPQQLEKFERQIASHNLYIQSSRVSPSRFNRMAMPASETCTKTSWRAVSRSNVSQCIPLGFQPSPFSIPGSQPSFSRILSALLDARSS